MSWRRAIVLAALVAPVALLARWSGGAGLTGARFVPRPDAVEYAAAAQSIAQTGRVFLQVGPLRVRSRYSPGWPLVLAAAIALGVAPTELWRVTGLFGAALAVLLAFAAAETTRYLLPAARDGDARGDGDERAGEDAAQAGRARVSAARARVAPWVAGLVAGLLWALAPLPVRIGRLLMSDEPATCVAALSLLLAVVALPGDGARDRGPLAAAVAAGLAFGLVAGMRSVTAALLVPPLLVLAAGALRRLHARGACARFAGFAAAALVVPALVCWLVARSGLQPWQWSGYAFWVPQWFTRTGDTFSLGHALRPDVTFLRDAPGGPPSHLGVAARILLGLPGLRAGERLGIAWPLAGWLAALPLYRLARARDALRARCGALALALWVLATVVLLAMYFHPGARFFLAPAAVCVFLLAAGAGVAWVRAPRATVTALVLLAGLGALAFLDLARQPPPSRLSPPFDRRAFHRSLHRTDAERAGRVVPFDPVEAQALGLLPPERLAGVRAWGELPPTEHVQRLRTIGLLPLAAAATRRAAPPEPARNAPAARPRFPS